MMANPADHVLSDYLAARIEPEPNSGCWLWIAATRPDGYGNADWPKRNTRAHRAVYEVLVGPIARGLVLDHRCRVRSCVNPAHLEAVTIGENVLRGDGITAVEARQGECRNGHPFDEDNTYVWRGRKRFCRACNRDRMRAIERTARR